MTTVKAGAQTVGGSRKGACGAGPNPKKGAMERSLVGLMSNALLSNALLNGLALGAVVLGGVGWETVRLGADGLGEQEGVGGGRSGVGIGEKPVDTRDAALQPTASAVPGGSRGETPW